MEYDSFSPFVAVDVALTAPVLRVGLVGATRYADTPSHRNSLALLRRAVQYFLSRDVTLVIHLGDVLSAENATAGTTQCALESIIAVRSSGTAVPWHVTFGPTDQQCFGMSSPGVLMTSTPPLVPAPVTAERAYYSIQPASSTGWRLIVLDCCDPTCNCNGIGSAQIQWLAAQVSVADAEGERVLIFTHRGLVGPNALTNADAIQAQLASHPGVVVAVVSVSIEPSWGDPPPSLIHP
jgi:hypothetical protein